MSPLAGEACEEREETRQIQRVGLYSFLINVGLTTFKIVLAMLSGSLAITAAAVDSTTDSVASLAVWGGLKLSARKSRRFPYGLYKIENVIQVVMALLIFFAGVEIAREILSPQVGPLFITPWIIVGMAITALIPLLFGYYAMAIGKSTGSPALVAEGRHRQVDVLSSLVVLGAVVSSYFGFPLDRIAAGLVLIFIGYAGWELLVDGMRALLDASVDAETLAQVRKIIESEPTVTHVRSLVGRSAGRYRFLQAEVELRLHDLGKAHVVTQRMEAEIRKQVRNVDRLLIHYEPLRKETLVVAIPLKLDREDLSEHFGEAPIFYVGVLRGHDGQILEERFMANPFVGEKKAKGIKVAQWLLQQGVDRVYTPRSLEGKGSGYALADAGVEVITPGVNTLLEIRKGFPKDVSS
jgi:cation diffusion facilitator family transporter